MAFGQELVDLLTRHSMFGRFLVHAWRWQCGGLNIEHSISVDYGLKNIS